MSTGKFYILFWILTVIFHLLATALFLHIFDSAVFIALFLFNLAIFLPVTGLAVFICGLPAFIDRWHKKRLMKQEILAGMWSCAALPAATPAISASGSQYGYCGTTCESGIPMPAGMDDSGVTINMSVGHMGEYCQTEWHTNDDGFIEYTYPTEEL